MTSGTDEVVRRLGGGPGAQLRVDAGLSLGDFLRRWDDRQQQHRNREHDYQRAVRSIPFPPVQFPVVAGALVQPTQAVLLGPEDGQVWDIRRVTVAGLFSQNAGAGQGSTANSNSVTNPGAGATIVAINSPPLGLCSIAWTVGLQGTVTAADASNMRLRLNAANFQTGEFPGVVGNFPMPTVVANLTGGAAAISAVAASSGASAIYTGQLVITPLAGTGDQVSLYRELITGSPGNPQNFLKDFSGPFSSPGPAWAPSNGLMLHSPDQLLLTGTGLIAASVTLSLEGRALEARWESRYLS